MKNIKLPTIGMRDLEYVDSTPQLHVGNSAFEDWFQGQPFATQTGIKQIARDSYAAGMGDPLVVSRDERSTHFKRLTADAFAKVSPEIKAFIVKALAAVKDPEHDGFAQEMAVQYGFEWINDDADVYACSAEALVAMMTVLGYGRISDKQNDPVGQVRWRNREAIVHWKLPRGGFPPEAGTLLYLAPQPAEPVMAGDDALLIEQLTERNTSLDARCAELERDNDYLRKRVPTDIANQVRVSKSDLLTWRAEWLEANDPQDGTDCTTPYDAYLYGGGQA